ncbi:MAG: 3-deoxy-7-phosphoheptulonate synthase class II [Rhodobacteraceae bacterium]|nr:3-deoxy-7-phosphoheptulonate synthase class II [Paracoccaceae bacterium]
MTKLWNKSGWRERPQIQMPEYPNQDKLNSVTRHLSQCPPLVFGGEVRSLREQLAEVCEGKRFLLQGGDCAESFQEYSADSIRDTFRIILQMAVVLTYATKSPIVKIGRIAGQFAKPRSSAFEKNNGIELPSYRGDIINDIAFNQEARVPNPDRMVQAYAQSAATLNLLRAFSQGGFADIKRVHAWTLEFTEKEESDRYHYLAGRITDALEFMEAAGVSANKIEALKRVDFFVSHEALLLEYEEALSRVDSITGSVIAGSGHFVWIGDRTRQPDGAHVEFCRGIENPVGIKCGPSMEPDELKVLLQKLNPDNIPGRITLIVRFGKGRVFEYLPKLITAVKEEGAKVIWSCDPMHGNTEKASNGYKTRRFENILAEVKQFFAVHREEGTIPGGVHFEMTGTDVTECTGGLSAVSDDTLGDRYHTVCDPRLNSSQSLELAFEVSEEIAIRAAQT